MKQLSDEPTFPPQQLANNTEQRAYIRHVCHLQAVSRPMELTEAMCWGALVRDISKTGVGIVVCYPFKPGTYLAIDLETDGAPRSVLGRVIHATDQSDGTWFVGCELVKELKDSDVEILL